MPSYYDILNVARSSSYDEIRAAYLRKVRLVVPSSMASGAGKEFQQLQKAYDVLSEPDLRTKYDAKLLGAGASGYNRDADADFDLSLAGNVVVDTSGFDWHKNENASTDIGMMTRMSIDVGLLRSVTKGEVGEVGKFAQMKRDKWAAEQVSSLARKFLVIPSTRVFHSVDLGSGGTVDAVVVTGNHAVAIWGKAYEAGNYSLGSDGVLNIRNGVGSAKMERYIKSLEAFSQTVKLVSVGFVVILPSVEGDVVQASGNTGNLRIESPQGFVDQVGNFLNNQSGSIFPKKFASLYDKV